MKLRIIRGLRRFVVPLVADAATSKPVRKVIKTIAAQTAKEELRKHRDG